MFRPWDRCFDFENVLAEKITKMLAFFSQIAASVCRTLIITLVLREKNFFFNENGQKL
jgi:hypothetical protein